MVDYIPQNNISTRIETHVQVTPEEDTFSQLLETFNSVSLAEMDSVKLMNRVDTKYIVSDYQLPLLLKMALRHYCVVEINGKRILPYSTVYFDTEDTKMYLMHHNGKLNRYKIRMRSYVDSKISFLEIKSKSNKGRTTKKRIGITNEQFEKMSLDVNEQLFLKKMNFQLTSLIPQIKNSFRRITLVDSNFTERVTLDIRLSFKNVSNGVQNKVADLVVVEIKQDSACNSHFRNYLNELRVKSGNMSKYCLGMMLVNQNLKSNSFKKKYRKITKITNSNHGTI